MNKQCECCSNLISEKIRFNSTRQYGWALCLACQGAYNLINEKPEHAKLMNNWLSKYGVTDAMISEKLKNTFWKDIFPTRKGGL